MEIGDYVRTNKGNIFRIEEMKNIENDGTWFVSSLEKGCLIKDLPRFMSDEYEEFAAVVRKDIADLIEPCDLLWVDIDPDDFGGIVVPKVPETAREINTIKEKLKDGKWVLKSITTAEQIDKMEYRL